MARSFHAMHSMVLDSRNENFGMRNEASDMWENVFILAYETIYIMCAKKTYMISFF